MTNPAAPLQIDTYLPYMRDVIRREKKLPQIKTTSRI